MSVPSATATIPVASATAAPPLLPPGVRVGSYGLRVTPNSGLCVCEPAAELGGVGLAHPDRAGGAHAGSEQRVLAGDVVGEQGRAERRDQALGVEQVLVGGRQAVQRPDRAAGARDQRRRAPRRAAWPARRRARPSR
jgi:hypothetical protein